jgi:hypothetical protein
VARDLGGGWAVAQPDGSLPRRFTFSSTSRVVPV